MRARKLYHRENNRKRKGEEMTGKSRVKVRRMVDWCGGDVVWGGDLASIMPVCVSANEKEMGFFFGFKRMK